MVWAMEIRQHWIDEIKDNLESDGLSWNDTVLNFYELPLEKQKELLLLPLDRHYACKLSHILTETSAKFYIEKK